ncbi:Uncharacterised protein [Neisseria gonorrhoeae]|uniref:Uncharacterized protein n=1 Tax=Neisseria gonorrhoeae TaxID=485 RepID=A0A378VYC6_NEIGO|nr:Uncharacterised protein [Neisseria gonorrhoeae]
MGKGKQTVRVDVFGDLLYEIANAGGGVQAGAISQWRAFCLLDVIRADAAGCKSVWEEADDAEDEAADAPFSFVLSSLLGERAASMIAASHKGSDDVLFSFYCLQY